MFAYTFVFQYWMVKVGFIHLISMQLYKEVYYSKKIDVVVFKIYFIILMWHRRG